MSPRPSTTEVTDLLLEITGVAPSEVVHDSTLVDLGIESLGAVRLRSRLIEAFGREVALTDLLGSQTVTGLHEALLEAPRAVAPARGTPVREPVERAPLTDVQGAYWVGRDPEVDLGGVATFWFHEYEITPRDPDDFLDRLETAWSRVVEHHPMLRAVVDTDGRQRVLPRIDWRMPRHDLRGGTDPESAADALRERDSHQILTATDGPLFHVTAVILPGAVRVHVGFDALTVDLHSWQLVMRQWGQLLESPGTDLPEPGLDFLAHVVGELEDPERRRRIERDRVWWSRRAPDLSPAPALPRGDEIGSHRFVRHRSRVSVDEWRRVQGHARARGATPSTVVLSAFTLALDRHCPGGVGTVALTLTQRPDLPGADLVVGDFAQTALLDLPAPDLAGGSPFARLVAEVGRRFYETVEHSTLGGVEVARLTGRSAGAFPVVFTSGLGVGADAWDGWLGRRTFGVSQTPQVLLDHLVWEEDGELVLTMDSVDEMLAPGLTEALLRTATRVLRTLAADASWEDTQLGWDPSGRLPMPRVASPFVGSDLIDDPVRARPASERSVSVSSAGESLDHARLLQRADAVAGALVAAGVGPGSPVLVNAPKSVGQIVAVLGVLGAGGAYVPVDPAWPRTRVESVVDRSRAAHAVVVGEPDDDVVAALHLHPDGTLMTPDPPVGVPTRPTADAMAYAIFTSGSTGTPKGVAETHRQVRTTLDDVVTRFAVTSDDRVLGLSALSFDLSVFDIFAVLGVGGQLVLPAPDELRDPAAWCRLVDEHAVTVWNTAPALLEMLVEHAEHDPTAAGQLSSLRLVMLSGDWIPVTLPDRLRALVPEAEVHSLGGATEASIWSITHPVGEIDPRWSSIPYGRALHGQSIHVLDGTGAPCRVGETGELFIGGEGVASGYLGDEEQTRQRFVEHPVLGQRLYRTGDLGRWRHDGTIEFLGRVDRQVKIQGFRIELGEVEAGLARCPGVRQAVAQSVDGPDGRPRLVAWVAGGGMDAGDLRRHLAAYLPPYMVPSRFVLSESLPVTANGKVDVKQLANPFRRREAPVQEVPAAPEVAGDHPLALLTEEVLGRSVDLTRGLTHNGATSLEVIRLANAAEQRLGRRPSVRAMMGADSIAAWIAGWDHPQGSADPAPVAPQVTRATDDVTPSTEGLPLPGLPVSIEVGRPSTVQAEDLAGLARWVTDIQRWASAGGTRLDLEWSADAGTLIRARLHPDADAPATGPAGRAAGEHFGLTEMQLAYLVGRADDWLGQPLGPHYYTDARVDGIDVPRLQRALDEVVRAHPMLRARATPDARQYVLAPDDPRARIRVQVHDLVDRGPAEVHAHLETVRSDTSHRVVDPVQEPGLSVQVTLVGDDSAHLHLDLDLLFVDAASAVLLVDDLRAAYEGTPVTVPEVDFAAWVGAVTESADGEHRRAAERYWRQRAGELAPPPRLPVRPTGQARVRRHEMRVDAGRWSAMTALAADRSVTPTALLLGSLAAVLAAVDGSGSTVVTTVFDRPAKHAGVVGDYTSTVLTSLPPSGARFVDMATAVHEQMWMDLEHSVGPSGVHGNEVLRMVAEQGRERRFPVAYSSGLGSTLGHDGRPRDAGRLLDGWGETGVAVSQTPHVAIDVQSFEVDGGLVVRWDAVDEVLPDGWVDAAFAAFCRQVRSLVDPVAWDEVPPRPELPTGAATATAPEPAAVAGSARTLGLVLGALEQEIGVPVGEGDAGTSFFDLGATSVSLVALQRTLADAGFTVGVVDLFGHPSPRRLAGFLDGAGGRAQATAGADVVSAPAPAPAAAAVEAPDRGHRRRAARRAARSAR